MFAGKVKNKMFFVCFFHVLKTMQFENAPTAL